MLVKNNYKECITNFACSIRKYFDLEYKHNTLEYVDKILEEVKPKNVVTILCDGMGSNIMDRVLPSNSFLIQNRIKVITTVFPTTTVAATTSAMTGLNPVETGMLGWYMYYKDIDKTIVTFLNYEKGDINEIPLKEALEYKEKNMITKSIMEEINDKGIDKGYTLFPFGDNCYENLDDMYYTIEKICNEDGKKYIYAYDVEPDHTMHELGSESLEVKDIIIDINNRVEKLSQKLKDTIIFVIADHGHITIENLFLSDYPEINDCLERTISLEPRTVNFFVKENRKKDFKHLFEKSLGSYFDLYDKDDIISSKLFGDGEENKIFKDALGDFIAIAKTNKAMLSNINEISKSQHAACSDDEIYVPIIAVKTKKL